MVSLEPTLIGDFLHRIRRPIDLISNKKYKLVTIKMKHKGVVLREEKLASNIKSKMYEVKEGDFILSGIDARNGAFGIIPKELDGAIVTNDFWYFDIDENIVDKHFFLELTTTQWFDELCRIGSDGTTQRIRLQKNKFFNQEINLPPIREQGKFISQFKKNKQCNDELKAELIHQKTLLKKLRQQILQEAIEGKLTVAWREQNPNVEPASELLTRIKEEKKQLVKDKKIKKQKVLPPINEEEIPFKLPDGWTYLRVEDFLAYKNRGMITGPFGTALQKNEHKPKGTPVWGIETIKNGKFTYKNKIFVTLEKAIELKSFGAKAGDILISRSGTIDEICVIPKDVDNGLISTNLLRLSLLDELVHSQYFCYLFKGSTLVLEKLKELCRGSTRLFLNQKILKALVFPVPPFKEQKEIITRVEQLFSICDQLEKQIIDSQTHSELLMQAVLKEAFANKSEHFSNHKMGDS